MLRLLIVALVFVSSILLVISNRVVDRSSVLDRLEHYLNTAISQDSLLITQYLHSEDDRLLLKSLENSPYFIEVYRNDSIVFWTDKTDITENQQASLLKIKSIIGDSSNYAHLFVNLADHEGYLQNSILKNANINQKVSLSKVNLTEEYISVGGSKIYVHIHSENQYAYLKGIAWFLIFAIFFIASFVLLRKLQLLTQQKSSILNTFTTLILLILTFKALHWFPAWCGFFSGFSGFTVLNVKSLANKNIIELFTNLWIGGILVYLVHLFIPYYKIFYQRPKLIASVTGFGTVFLFGMSVYLIEGFVMSDLVNLEIETLLTFNSNSFALIICFSILMILIFQCTQFLYENLHTSSPQVNTKYVFLPIGWIAGIASLVGLDWLHVPLWIFIVFILAYALILDAYVEKREKKVTYLIWWLIMFSGFLAVCLFYFGLKKDINSREQFLEQYYVQADSEVVDALNVLQDSLIQSGIFVKIASLEIPAKLDMKDLEDYIFKQSTFKNQSLDRSIELFDKKGNTLFSNHFANYFKTNQALNNSRKVGRNIYHNPFEDKYIIRLEIAKTIATNTNWFLYIIHQNKNIDRKKYLAKTQSNHGYAIYNHNILIEKNNSNQAIPDLDMLSLDKTQIMQGYSYVVANPSSQYKLVSFKKVSGLIKPISLFSFIFTLCGIILLLLSFINTQYDFLPESLSLKFGSRSSLKTKIQISIILLILVTFLIIGAITGFYFKNLIEVNQKSKNKEETATIINNIISDIQNMPDNESVREFLNSKLKEYSYVHDKELSLYDNYGSLVGSSIKGANQLKIPFAVWNATRTNMVSNLADIPQYDSSNTEYEPLYVNNTNPVAFIGISHKSLDNSSKSILDFLSTILNAYIFLFLIAGAIAITIANSITQPLSILAEKLKKFKLGKSNELLEWKSNDEIGTLIHDYNNLTQELERSAGMLAKTERDMAWREMAKQVAHEIKNPLTPMKLSIQYLHRTAQEYPEKATELIPRISSTLIEQIDNLTQIANEFSNFATMPQASNEKIILNEVVEAIHDLFRKRDDMDINMIEPIDDLYVFADKNHLVRILNNLLKNAIQAIPETRRGKIEIELKRQENNAVIRVTDNGSGIPDHMKDKVFTPNFTTKSSGTGLGLAISANMIESFNGKIYFETKEGVGTDFYVSIPLMRLDDYFKGDDNRVSLD